MLYILHKATHHQITIVKANSYTLEMYGYAKAVVKAA